MTLPAHELCQHFRRSAGEAAGASRALDAAVNGVVGWVNNRRPVLSQLLAPGRRVEPLEKKFTNLVRHTSRVQVEPCNELARPQPASTNAAPLDRGMALSAKAAQRTVGIRPFPVQIIGALAMCQGLIAEMATGEGKTLTAALAASIWGWAGRPVHSSP